MIPSNTEVIRDDSWRFGNRQDNAMTSLNSLNSLG